MVILMKRKIMSALLSAFLALQIAAVPALASDTAAAQSEQKQTVPLSIAEKTPSTNLLSGGDFDTQLAVASWSNGTQKVTYKTDENGGYMEFSRILVNYAGFTYKITDNIPAGTYKLSGYVRTKNPGAVTCLRLYVNGSSGNYAMIYLYPTSEWLKFEMYFTFTSKVTDIRICGGPYAEFVQSYCVDGFCIEKVDSIPANQPTSFGKSVTPAEAEASDQEVYEADLTPYDREAEGYEIQGVVINQDADGFMRGCNNVTEQQLIDYAKGFGGSHCTDYVICLNNTNATFKSDTWTDLDDKYHQKVENGQPVDYTSEPMILSAHYLNCIAGLDYIDLWCKTFPTVGINPWLSFRMNDAHHLALNASYLLSDYFHEHKEIRRVQNASLVNSYYNYCQDYQYELVRNHMLDLIGEALSKYDAYGIELDWMREMWLWHFGGEYEGLEILNGFMHDVEALVAKYEEKYGHEIKIGVRVATTPKTNYDFGLDITTWASEGIIDVVTTSGRYTTTDNDVPVALWKSILDPYGVDFWYCIEGNVCPSASATSGGHTLETYCGTAASAFSQGADKVYLFNYMRSVSTTLTEKDRYTTTDPAYGVSTGIGYWNVISTIGSYDKLMTRNRRVVLTFNDIEQVWVNSNQQLPKNAMPGTGASLHMPMGDIPNGAQAFVKFSVSDPSAATAETAPTVYINGHKADFVEVSYIPEFTTQPVLTYRVPDEVTDSMYAHVEISPQKQFIAIGYAEVYIKAPETVDNSKITSASNTPSSWATEEVNAAIGLGIVPEALQSAYRDTITRAEFCKLIMQMLNEVEGTASSRLLLKAKGIEYADNFIDTDNPDIIAANLLGILNGRGNGIFDPNSGITRQEAAVMLANAAKVLGIKAGTAPTFKDMDKAASWAADAIKTVTAIKASTGNNVMNGTGNDEFSPLATYTREQSVLTVYRLYMAK